MIGYIILLGLIVGFPIFYLVVLHEKVLVMQFMMPLLDHTTDRGHLVLTAIHVGFIVFGGLGNYGGDMYFFLFVTHVPLIKNIFSLKLEEFNEVVVKRNEFPKSLGAYAFPPHFHFLSRNRHIRTRALCK